MTFLLVARLFPPDFVGGIQTYSYELAKHLTTQGHQVWVLAPGDTHHAEWDAQQPFSIQRIPGAQTKWLKTFWFFWYYWKLSQKVRPDFVLATIWAPSALVAALVSKRRAFPIVTFVHGTELGHWGKHWLGHRLLKWVLHQSSYLIANSHFTAQQIEYWIGKHPNVSVIPCGVALDRFQPTSSQNNAPITSNPILFSLAALSPRKGIDYVIQAMPQILKYFPNLQYRIAGSGPDQKRLEQLAIECGVDAHVTFLGRVSDEACVSEMQQCDLFVMPARQIAHDYEGFGIVFLEANACAKPVIAGNSGGIPDAVLHEKTGLLVPPEDEEAIAEAIVTLLSDETVYRTYQEQALKHAQHFTWANTAQQVEAILQGRHL